MHLRWFLKHKKHFSRKKWESSKVRAECSRGRAEESTVKTRGALDDFRWESQCGKVVGDGAGRAGWVPFAEGLKFIQVIQEIFMC